MAMKTKFFFCKKVLPRLISYNITEKKDQYKKQIYLNLKNYDKRVAITKLRLLWDNLAIKRAKCYNFSDD